MDISKALKQDEPRICQICKADFAKYNCPRCGLPYCSLTCYKDLQKHLKCSESFYKECIEECIKENEKDGKEHGESSKQMQEILKRFRETQGDLDGILNDEDVDDDSSQSESSLDSDDDEPLAKRMEGVNLDDANTVWSKLTLDEKKGFQKFVQEYQEKYNVKEDDDSDES